MCAGICGGVASRAAALQGAVGNSNSSAAASHASRCCRRALTRSPHARAARLACRRPSARRPLAAREADVVWRLALSAGRADAQRARLRRAPILPCQGSPMQRMACNACNNCADHMEAEAVCPKEADAMECKGRAARPQRSGSHHPTTSHTHPRVIQSWRSVDSVTPPALKAASGPRERLLRSTKPSHSPPLSPAGCILWAI